MKEILTTLGINIDINNIHLLSLEEVIYNLLSISQLIGDYFYPYIITYIIYIKSYTLILMAIIFILFNITYIGYNKIKKNNFSGIKYCLMFILMPFSVVIYTILFIDVFIKKYIIYKLFHLEYPYIKYEIRKEMKEIDDIMKIKTEYMERFNKGL